LGRGVRVWGSEVRVVKFVGKSLEVVVYRDIGTAGRRHVERQRVLNVRV